MNNKKIINKRAMAKLPTSFGVFKLHVYVSKIDNQEHIVLSMGNIKEPVLTRIHSQCLTGDTLFSLKCDCGEQLKKSMEIISKKGTGIILYLPQEGRGVGLTNKIKAYALQDQGLDTVEANSKLGLPIDARSYKIAAEILKDLGISAISLLTNNPNKEESLTEYGIKIADRISLEIPPNNVNGNYLITKKKKLGHRLTLV
ncbi:MAG: GTP cyclohydrolase II [Candidatus Levybacteria bacterium]|nr:GTP cyclohydrolase II [Candidatus Levybacteria bacterium]